MEEGHSALMLETLRLENCLFSPAPNHAVFLLFAFLQPIQKNFQKDVLFVAVMNYHDATLKKSIKSRAFRNYERFYMHQK